MQTELTWPVWRYAWRIYRFLPWRYLGYFLIILGGWLLFVALGLLPSQFFDTLTGVKPSPLGVWGLLALLGGFELARALCNFGWATVGVGTEYRVRALLQRNLVQQILVAPAAQALPFSTGETVNRLRDDVNTLSGLLSSWTSFLGAVLFALIGLLMMARISLLITLLVFLPLVVIILVSNRLRPTIEGYRLRSRQTTGDTTGALGEIFHAVLAIKVARAEERMVGYVAGISDRRQQAALQDRLFNLGLDALFGCTSEIGMSLILLFAAAAMQAGSFTVGSFALFVFYLDFVPSILSGIGNLLPEYRQVGVAVARLQVMLHGAPPQQLVQPQPSLLATEQQSALASIDSTAEPLQVLAVRNLSYRHGASQQGVQSVSFRLARGQCLVITGRIGAGKTTLLRTLLGLLPKQQGEITWNDKLIEEPGTFFVPPRCAYTAQTPRLFSESLRNNLLLGQPEEQVDLPNALYRAVLTDEFSDLDMLLGARGMRLSGGQQQRVAAARMFTHGTELLVIDDLASALDLHTEQQLWARLFVDPHPTLLIVSHRPEVLQRADHILVLRNGRVVDEGPLTALLSRNEEIRSIWYGADTEASPDR